MTSRFPSARTAADPVTIGVGAVLAGVLVLGITGCSGIQRLLQHEHEESFATYAEASEGWVGVAIPAWIPASATDLRNLATTNEQMSVVRVATPDEPVGACETGERLELPALTADWTPEWATGLPGQALHCGDYEIVPVEGGWLGWFNAEEEGQTPGSSPG